MKILKLLGSLLSSYFTLWIILFSAAAYMYPAHFAPLSHLITPTLGVIMFGMGMTITSEDARRLLSSPREIFIGVAAQYSVMPATGFIVARGLGLEPLIAAGVALVGACPGGTASNVITYLARGDVALSVAMTSVSTLLSPLFTPVMIYLFAGRWIDVPVWGLFISTIEIVLLPIALGISARALFRRVADAAAHAMPLVSSVGIIFIVGVIVAANAESIGSLGAGAAMAVILHNSIGLALGYCIAKFAGMSEPKRRALAIEVGMQNSGLGVALAKAHFGAVAALPAAMFSVWHNVAGSLLAFWWRRRDAHKTGDAG
ncbi:MAG: bile acid:sodium symporter family protein [Deltaproteobacteria bacterium]